MAVAVASSVDFLTPIGYQTNTMVYGPGGYRFGDYARLGAPLTVLVVAVIVVIVPMGWSDDRRPRSRTDQAALKVAEQILAGFQSGNVASFHKSNLDPVTEADLAFDRALREVLVQDGRRGFPKRPPTTRSR